jgi:hypothetical protein
MPRLGGGRLHGALGQDVGAAVGSHREASHYINNERVRISLYVCFADTGMDLDPAFLMKFECRQIQIGF